MRMGGDGSGPTRESGLDKVWTMVRNGGDAYEAWQACGEPTTWGNAQRFLRKARAEAPSSGSAGSSLHTAAPAATPVVPPISRRLAEAPLTGV